MRHQNQPPIVSETSDLISEAIEIIENGEADIVTGLGTFTAEERDTILRALYQAADTARVQDEAQACSAGAYATVRVPEK